MRRMPLTLSATLLLACVAATPSLAANTRAFAGLFEGVDTNDGSLTQRQIICADGASCTVLGSDTFFSLCVDSDGRGILQGDGTIRGDVLSVPAFTLTCADGTTAVTVPTTFTLDRGTGTLVEQVDPTVAPTIQSITFHRINAPLRQRR